MKAKDVEINQYIKTLNYNKDDYTRKMAIANKEKRKENRLDKIIRNKVKNIKIDDSKSR